MKKLYIALTLMFSSLCANAQFVSGTIGGHDYVDLGLPSGTLWATCNIGAEFYDEPDYPCLYSYGDCFVWGETEPDGFNDWGNYKYCNGKDSTMTKYCTDSKYGTVDNITELEPEDDPACVLWGSEWRTPSIEQLKELFYNDSISISFGEHRFDLELYSLINKNVLFISSHQYVGSYWSRTLNTERPNTAYCISFDGLPSLVDLAERRLSLAIRPVVNTDATSINSITSTSSTPQYYTLDGKQVSNTSYNGVYIVKKDGRTFKVIK